MKQLICLLQCIVIFGWRSASAQCNIILDESLHICDPNQELPANLGQSLQITGGVEPYTFYWSTFWEPWEGASMSLDEHDLLDDPTAMHPNLIMTHEGTTHMFTLTVTDAENNTCAAEISVVTSCFITMLVLNGNNCGSAAISPGGSVSLCTPIAACLEPATYSWTPTAGLDDPTSVSPIASPDEETLYTCVITDAWGCSYTSQFQVNFGINSISESKESRIQLIPNPASDKLQIINSNEGIATVTIKDLWGRTVLDNKAFVASSFLDISLLSQGSYFCQIQLQNGNVEILRFIKQ